MTIVEELRQNRESGAKRLEAEYKAGLMALARRFCDDESDAAELVNRTFAAVVEGIDDYLEQSAFFGWMSQILVNIHSTDVRRKSNRTVVYPGEVPEACDETATGRIDGEVDASLLRDAIQRLPEDQRELLLLHYFMDMPIAKIAKFLAIPQGTVMSRLHYARKALATKLGAAAQKPGVKALLLALLLAALTAAGAAVVVARSDATTAMHNAQYAMHNAQCIMHNEESGQQLERSDDPNLKTSMALAQSNPSTLQPSTPSTNAASTLDLRPSTFDENKEPTMNTKTRSSIIAAAALGATTALAANLPDGYTKVEYIQGDGSTSYLVADFSPDPSNDTIVAEAELTSNANAQFLFLSAAMNVSDTSPKQGVLLRKEGVRFDYYDNGTACYSAELAATVGRRITYTVTRGRMTWTGGMPVENSNPAPAAWSGPLQILGSRYKGAATFCSSIKLYSLKVFRDGRLIHDFVPVVDDQSNPTLLDVCGNSAVTAYGTLYAGPAVWLEVADIPVQQYRSGQVCEPHPTVVDIESGVTLSEGTDYTLSWADNDCVGKGSVTFTGIGTFDGKSQTATFSIVPRLPVGYKSVEYAHSSGEQLVDTGFTPNEKTRADIRFLMHSNGGYTSPFGARNANEKQFFVSGSCSANYYFCRHDTGATDLSGKDGYVGPGALVVKPPVVGYHKFSLNRNVFNLDEYAYNFSSAVIFSCDRSAYAFATHGADGIQHPAAMELYSLKIWDDGVLVRDFVPCVKVEGGVETVGLYDVSRDAMTRFYENGGSGALVAGPDVVLPQRGLIISVR